MTDPNNPELQRDMGRMEGTLAAMEKRMDHLEKTVVNGFKEVNANIRELGEKQDTRLTALETDVAEKRGGWKMLAAVATVAGTVGGFLGALLKYLMG